MSAHVKYQVFLEVDCDTVEKYTDWLKAHVDEMLTFTGFLGAEIKREGKTESGEREKFMVDYKLDSRESLGKYFEEHAPRMRADGMKRFEGKFSATRKILDSEGNPIDM